MKACNAIWRFLQRTVKIYYPLPSPSQSPIILESVVVDNKKQDKNRTKKQTKLVR